MANKIQLAILKKGVKEWNKWQEDRLQPYLIYEGKRFIGLSVEYEKLRKPNLCGANLTGRKLRKARLNNVNLGGAILSRADLRQVNFQDTDLSGADLQEADLRNVDFRRATIDGANFRNANLNDAVFTAASLVRANLEGAHLWGAYLGFSNFQGANLTNADFRSAIFLDTRLHGADVSGSLFSGTVIGNSDLSATDGLSQVRHGAPSIISIDTIYRSKGSIPDVFLRGCGVPENFLIFMRSLTSKAFDFYSCFISHSAKDKRFCERLYADLQAKGVRVWYFPEDAKWGETVWGEIDRSIKVYDKLIVVLSENSLQSGPVNREIERALIREDKEGKGILFPIRIDDYIFDTWEHERKTDVLRKVVGDFSGWDKDAAKYEKAFDKLLKGLQAESGKA